MLKRHEEQKSNLTVMTNKLLADLKMMCSTSFSAEIKTVGRI